MGLPRRQRRTEKEIRPVAGAGDTSMDRRPEAQVERVRQQSQQLRRPLREEEIQELRNKRVAAERRVQQTE